MKKILFIGNSFTYFNDLPAMTETLLKNAGISCRAASVTKGGAYLHEYADREHELNRRFEEAYGNESYDFVVLQDQSFNPAGDKADFMAAVHTLSAERTRAFCSTRHGHTATAQKSCPAPASITKRCASA